ncbi:MAG: hypothetical protein PHZ09_11685 [Eubacteriales bacterium]|nr:hypothetical protein [Eubacteriales bacterium]
MRLKLLQAIQAIFILCGLLCLSGCETKNEISKPSLLTIVEGGGTDYVIIRSDIAGDDEIKAAVMLRDALLEATGVKLTLMTDWVKGKGDIDFSAREIIVGKTNRIENNMAAENGECVIAVSGDRIIITGEGSGAAVAAAEYFISDYVTGPTVSVPKNTDVRFFIYTAADEGVDVMPLVTQVKTLNDIPRLYINDKLTVPLLFFGNTDIGTNVTEQAQMAARAGINLHSVIYNLNFDDDYTDTGSYAYTNLRACLDAVLKGDPDAKIILRVNTGAFFNPQIIAEDDWRYKDRICYTDGTAAGLVSTASDRWAEEAKRRLTAIVEYMRSSPDYMDHIACIHLEKGEWFEFGFREKGSDISETNDEGFRRWLTDLYKTDDALNTAWNVSYGIGPAAVPRDLPNNVSSDHSYPNTLMLTSDEQRYIDYLDYIGRLVSGRIDDFAKTIKTASDGNLLVIAFYGYLFELSDAQSGHYDMQRLLNSAYIDGFAAPVSYDDRTGPNGGLGATSAYMTAVDSVTRHGKIWFQESDQRTFVNGSPDGGWLPSLRTIDDIFQVHRREAGMSMVHANAMWAMDLTGTGWLLDQRIWDNLAELNTVYADYMGTQTKAPTYDVVFVIDEKAESIAGQPSRNISMNLLSATRLEAYHAGVQCAFAEITDIIDGRFDDAKLYIFMNPYRISDDDAAILADRLQSGGKTAVFMYGFGKMEPSVIKMLCGMDIAMSDSGSTNMKLTEEGSGAGFIRPEIRQTVTPRYGVTGGRSATYAEYSDGSAAAAVLYEDSVTRSKSVFYGGTHLNRQNIRALCAIAGVNIISDGNDVVTANDTMIVYCASSAGQKTISLGESRDVYDYFNDKYYENISSLKFGAALGETYYFFLGDTAKNMMR